MTATILKFDKAQRRAGFSRLAEGYSDILAKTILLAKMDDGMLDPNVIKTDRRQVRELTTDERRHAAVYLATQFFCGILGARAAMEDGNSGQVKFLKKAVGRVGVQWAGDVGPLCKIVAEPETKGELLKFETDMARGIFRALQLEAPRPSFDEPEFWRDVFLGLSDADPSNVVAKAARVVLLHYPQAFRDAIEADARTDTTG